MPISRELKKEDTITQKKQRLAIKAKVGSWKKQGYLVHKLDDLLSEDFDILQESFFDHVHDVKILEKVKQELGNLNTKGFEEKARAIEMKLFDPTKADELTQELENLKKELMITIKNVPDLSRQESLLRKELDRIRKETMDQVKREEIKRIRTEERGRLIRIAEKQIRKKEAGKIKQQEKERMTWIKHLKDTIPESKKEAIVKRVKTCPSCKNKITISSDKRPLRIQCSKCGREYTLKSEKDRTTEKPLKRKKCPSCGDIIEIFSSKRPLKVNCRGCGKEFTLKGKGDREAKTTETQLPTVKLDDILGKKIKKEQANSNLEMKSYGHADKYDPEPGSQANETECPHCGTMVPSEFKRCGMCGELLNKETSSLEDKDENHQIIRPEDKSQQGIFAGLQKAPEPQEPGSGDIPSPGTNNLNPSKPGLSDIDLPSFTAEDDTPVFKEDISKDAGFPKPFITDHKKDDIGMELPEFDMDDKDELGSFTPDTPSFTPPNTGKRSCPGCGTELPPGVMFCGTCGHRM